jgi:pyruvate dehydrogenase E2 component (dihydrolipoamide acetyltransferase)
VQFQLPDVGEGITESVLLRWHVRPGQSVKEDDVLCTIETDKAVVDIPAPCTGTVISLDVPEGTTVAVGTVIAQVDAARATQLPPSVDPGSAAGMTASTSPRPQSNSPQRPVPTRNDSIVPSTRRHANSLGVDLSTVTGTGPHGRILRSDVDAVVALTEHTSAIAEGTPARQGEFSSERTPMSRLRRLIAENMRRSVSIIPHATASFRCDAGAFVEFRDRCQERFGVRVSYTALLMKAMIAPLKAHPYFNASIDDATQEIITHRMYNIAFAAHTDEGLIAPVVKSVDRKSLVEVHNEVAKLVGLAREHQIALDGSHSSRETGGRPIITHPQVAIVAVGAIRAEPAVYKDVICVRPIMNLTTSFDHRLIDGVHAAAFMEHVMTLIECPESLTDLN